jgi:DNA-binding GntR family transcriptional regulator
VRSGSWHGGRPASRYSTLARLLTEEIEAGRYKVGQKIPTEAALQQRFDVSRHTVREALRDLKTQGIVTARAGIGTVVRAKGPPTRFMQGIGTLKELIQFVEATRMKVLKRRVVIADEDLAEQVAVKVGQELHQATVLRFLPKEPAPVAWMHIYVRPEYGDVLDLIDTAGQPVFSLIERRHGARIAEVRQQIVAVALEDAEGRVLKARAGTPALHIARQYFDAQDRMVMASVGLYPSDRFSHNTRFRIQHSDEKDSR